LQRRENKGQRVHDGQAAENSRGWHYLEFEIYAFDNRFTNSQMRRKLASYQRLHKIVHKR